jgi:hypothetical protein
MLKRLLLAALALPALGGAALAFSAGTPARANTQLAVGWNNVSYLGDTQPPTEALAPIAGKYSAVYRWDAAQQKYEMYAPAAPAYTNSISSIATGDALWVLMTGSGGSLPSTVQTGTGDQSGKVAVPASAFMPASDLALYEKTFNEIHPVSNDEASKRYFAPVHLPDGATVTGMTPA